MIIRARKGAKLHVKLRNEPIAELKRSLQQVIKG